MQPNWLKQYLARVAEPKVESKYRPRGDKELSGESTVGDVTVEWFVRMPRNVGMGTVDFYPAYVYITDQNGERNFEVSVTGDDLNNRIPGLLHAIKINQPIVIALGEKTLNRTLWSYRNGTLKLIEKNGQEFSGNSLQAIVDFFDNVGVK